MKLFAAGTIRSAFRKSAFAWYPITMFLLAWTSSISFAQPAPTPYGPVPTPRQLSWQETELYCIIHFGLATCTDKEWGYGNEDPQLFQPKHFSALQILGAAKAAGFKGAVIVAKHHDGFCLWPTATTSHNISKSLYKNGHGDLLKEYQAACRQLGLKIGVYCSPWDRNSALYGRPEYVTQVYQEQLRELYHNYGPLFMSWHDGANGGDGYYGGTGSTRTIDRTTYYDWENTWAITRSMQPGACIFGDVGPDVRWVGNEDGRAGETSWATYTPRAVNGNTPANGNVYTAEATEGTRNGKYWMPAECDVPLRPGWFYHPSQDGKAKTPEQLAALYYNSVGRGACLDIGLSPDRNGMLHSGDIASLKQFGSLIRQTFAVNLIKGASFLPDNVRGGNMRAYGPGKLCDGDRYSYWATDDSITTAALAVDLHTARTFNVIRLRENIKLGQRIDSVSIDAWEQNSWHRIAFATSIGACRLIRLHDAVTASKLKLHIYAPVCIALSDFGLFREPASVAMPIITRSHDGKVQITAAAGTRIRYAVNGSVSGKQSLLYKGPFTLLHSGQVKAISFGPSGRRSHMAIQHFGLLKQHWKIHIPGLPENAASTQYAADDDPDTVWEYTPTDSTTALPKEILVDMGRTEQIKAFTYLPRQDKKTAGIASGYIFQTSDDRIHWHTAAEGEFPNINANPAEQVISLARPVQARYFKFTVRRVISGNSISIAELGAM